MVIKIYPNPTTEKITLQISNMENLQTGIFKLFSLTGQLLQEQPVHSTTTVVSLAGLSKGSYILKVHINGVTEDWKIIKN
ncbi:MAG: T9SS type A sorting domain-containing protein [Bacteroidetes bacterium]|nr:T9SS type A sorting domain-containing protein [Bacteroidota bacterium]MCL2302206.1 T9SS type A sorting domain-containing protein [Lentimicrobiaceae bacterium]MCL2302286.1 T9SS type A sorting domain-containing protein [Lentimicrobiaceae bacterium]